MHANSFPKPQAFLAQKSFERTAFVESRQVSTEPVTKKTEGTKLDATAIPNGAMFLFPVGLVVLFTFIAFRLAKVASRFSNVPLRLSNTWEVTGEEMLAIKYFHKFPCRNCRYFANNPYLKCAVQPDIALTVRSLNCSDYCPQNERY